MKQITLPLPDLKKEALIAGACLLLAFGLNVYAIMVFKTPWTELFTSLLWVLAIAVTLYLSVAGLRLCRFVIIRLIKTHTEKRS